MLYRVDTFIVNIKTEDVYEDIANIVEKNISSFKIERSLPVGKN